MTCHTLMEFFGNRFVKRFIEVHPVVKHMFNKNTVKQGTLFFRMISFTVTALDDESKFESQFAALVKTHNRMGIRAVECKLRDYSTAEIGLDYSNCLLVYRWHFRRVFVLGSSFDSWHRGIRCNDSFRVGEDLFSYIEYHHSNSCSL